MDILLGILSAALTDVDPGNLPTTDADPASMKIILGIVFGIVGALALLMITIAGLRYITAAGDPQTMAKARTGIIVALIGLAIALAAEAIVVFVVGRL